MVLQFVRLHSKSLAKTSRVRQIVLSRKMHYELLSLFSVWFYSFLDCILSSNAVASQSFQLSLAGNNHCPNPVDAFQSLTVQCIFHCAFECKRSPRCIDFSFYASSGRCYLYSSLPSKVSYDNDCNFMMVSFKCFLYEVALMRNKTKL